ncbi:unnamed protein product [Alopecurus aequalis]
MAAPPSRRPSPAVLPDEIVEEILLRLPPEHPACLLRASLVCKTWSHALSSPGFRRRLHERHRTPPMLGFFHNCSRQEHIPRFVPTTASSFSLAAPDHRSWGAIDCRHGRALFLSKGKGTKELLVWEPITGAQWRVSMPAAFQRRRGHPNAAVLCAADGCDHRDCQGGPFHLVFLFYVEVTKDAYEDYVTSACVYSSRTDTWGELTSAYGGFLYFTCYSSLLVGTSLLYFVPDNRKILEYDLARHSLTVLATPDCYKSSNLMLMADGGLGVIQNVDLRLELWSREVSDGTWLLSRVISLETLLPDGALLGGNSISVSRFSEEADAIFVTAAGGLFTVELQSHRARKVCDDHGFRNMFPVVNFYTPHSRLEALGGEHHYPPLPLSPTKEVCCKEGGGEAEKTLEQTQEVLNKGNAMEEGNFANSNDRFSHTLETRVPHHGELPLDNPSENVSRNAINEESVKDTATTGKNYPGSSEASDGVHGDSEEGILHITCTTVG